MIPARTGTLENETLPGLLRPLVRDRGTGVLRCSRRRVVKTVYVSEGRLIFATSTDPDDRLGEMLLRKGLITYRALEDSVRALQVGKRQGTLLVENGAIRSRDLIEGVTEQVQEIIYGLFRWDDGDYQYTPGDLPSREVIVLRMSTADLLMEAIRRVTQWSRIRVGVGGLEQKYTLSAAAARLIPDMTLPQEEHNLLAVIEENMNVEEICAASDRPDFQVCRTIWGLWAAGVLDRVPQDRPAEGAAPVPAREESPAERTRGASVIREIERFNEIHRMVFELVTYEMRERAPRFFERAFRQIGVEHPALFEGVAVHGTGDLDPIVLRRNIASGELVGYPKGLDRLLELEMDVARELLGEKKAAIIQDGILALKEQQLSR